MPSAAARIHHIARRSLGHEGLRPGQEEAARAILAGRDTLAVMPTGSGKSAIYQISALELHGPTLVVSPLIALQRDQVEAIEERELGGAAQANSTLSESERQEALDDLRQGELEFLFVAPEQLANEETLAGVAAARPSLLVVDEAHCISSWGHDFRPDYLRLGTAAEALGRPTILALTATASPPVRAEIVERLRLRDPVVIVRGFDRPNIRLEVERVLDPREKDRELFERIRALPGPGIVYVATRKAAESVADALAREGLRAAHYHGGMRARPRTQVQQAFMDDELDLIVATTAFGMGIDKPDVRFVIHYDISDSLDYYYQEIGRAGRDGEEAVALLLYRPEDLGLRRFFAGSGRLGEEQLRRVAVAVHEAPGPLSTRDLRHTLELSSAKLTSALSRLEATGALELAAGGVVAPRPGGPAPAAAARQAAESEESHRRVEQSRLEMMRTYAETRSCRRQVLLGYFGEHLGQACGNCDACDSLSAVETPEVADGDHPFPVACVVEHRAWGRGQVVRHDEDAVVVLFDQVGYKTLSVEMVLERHIMRRQE